MTKTILKIYATKESVGIINNSFYLIYNLINYYTKRFVWHIIGLCISSKWLKMESIKETNKNKQMDNKIYEMLMSVMSIDKILAVNE